MILGAGPAGVSCALRLKKLGHKVLLISQKRPFSAIEGLSQRALEGLRQGGLTHTLNSIKTKVPRYATWNNETFEKNFEYIVERDLFDAMLLKDAQENDIEIIFGMGKIDNLQTLTVKVSGKTIQAKYIVDARGRFAPKNSKQKSPATSSFLVRYKNNQPQESKTSLKTSKHGWIWQATHQNFTYFQLTSSPKNGKTNLQTLLKETIDTNQHQIVTRDSSSYIANDIIQKNYIKIGDAACAVDPLSGNGVFQALSSSLLAPYVIHTLLLGKDEDKDVAHVFFTERVSDIFRRYTTNGQYFYAQEKTYQTPFWTQRAQWSPANKTKPLKNPEIQTKAILDAPFIKKHEVVVTNESPMGIWRLGRINLVPIVKTILSLENTKREAYLQTTITENNFTADEQAHLFHWCRENHLIV